MNNGNWIEVDTEADIVSLMNAFGGFHDSCIREIYYWTAQFVDTNWDMRGEPDTHIRVLIQRQWENASAIELLFGEVISCTIAPPLRGFSPDIYRMWIVKSENGFRWSESPDEEFQSDTRIMSKKLWWRDVSDWMGDTIRYSSLEDLPALPLFNP
ncbi:MAG: hypothetical protein K8R88_13460 [Armatimonadetes bacterium]|nr:hypothetical protein [Armatimonadota bacterium]